MKTEPKIKPIVTITVEEKQTTFNGNYELIAVHPNGMEKPGTQFEISAKGFDRLYKDLTAPPEGTAAIPQFKVKKNPKI